MQELEQIQREVKDINPIVNARHKLDELFRGNPTVTLSDVRQGFNAVAKSAHENNIPSIWSALAPDAAICLIMGISPNTGAEMEITEETLQHYDRQDYTFGEQMRPHYNHFLQNPRIQSELQREADLKQLTPQT